MSRENPFHPSNPRSYFYSFAKTNHLFSKGVLTSGEEWAMINFQWAMVSGKHTRAAGQIQQERNTNAIS